MQTMGWGHKLGLLIFCCKVCDIYSFFLVFLSLFLPLLLLSPSPLPLPLLPLSFPLQRVPLHSPQVWGSAGVTTDPKPHLRNVGIQDSSQAGRTAPLRSPHSTREGSISSKKSLRFLYLWVC